MVLGGLDVFWLLFLVRLGFWGKKLADCGNRKGVARRVIAKKNQHEEQKQKEELDLLFLSCLSCKTEM